MKNEDRRIAVFAGGCFWCVEADFEKTQGVLAVIAGYTGGYAADPTYEQVSAGSTGHMEAVKVVYDPSKVSYEALLDVFWRHVDPTDEEGQFVDRGAQYLSAVFYGNEVEKTLAEQSKKALADSGVFQKPIVTQILPLGEFYDAEDYHQDYYKRNPLRYKWYRSGSGRDKFLKNTWKDAPPIKRTDQGDPVNEASGYVLPSMEERKKKLTPLQYRVTQAEETEPPFKNEYWDNSEPGIYVDIVSGEPLFASTDKFDSGTGWPSFTRPLEPENIVEKKDRRLVFMTRTEVRSKLGDSHLGHVFDDGPAPTGLRYCLNSAALQFIHKNDLRAKGYGQYEKLFQ